MTEEVSKQKVVIDDVEYLVEDLSDTLRVIINHLVDLDRKISSTQFNLVQLQVGRGAFMEELKQNLETKEEAEAA